MNVNSKAEIFWDLRRFLRTENVELEGLTKQELKNWYSDEYKTYRQQISPDEKLPSFFVIMQAVYRLKLAHYEDDTGKLVLGPSPELPRNEKEKSPKHKKKKPKDKQPQSKTAEGQKVKHTSQGLPARVEQEYHGQKQIQVSRRFLMNQNRMAVDQHLTFKSGLARVIDQPDFKGRFFQCYLD